jgi:WS/DGAT/MGAT family acyltransferase
VEGLEGGKAAVIQKIHHALTDGVGGMKLAMLLLDLDRGGPAMGDPPELEPAERPSWWGLLSEAAGHNFRRNLGLLRRGISSTRPILRKPELVWSYVASTARMLAPARAGASPLFTSRGLRRHLRTLSLDLETIKAAGKSVGGTLNDAFIAGIAGGLGHYHDALGAPAKELRFAMPISVRSAETHNVAGNQFAPTRLMVPTGGDPADRLREISARVRATRAEPALEIVSTVAGIMNVLPTSAAIGIFGPLLRTVDVTASNVPGSPIPVFLAGSLVESTYAFGPTAGAAINCTLLSYRSSLDIGIVADADAVSDPELLVACFEESFREIEKLAA